MSAMVVSEQSRRATLAQLPLGAFETGPDGAWDYVSPALIEMLGGLPTSSLLGREWLNRVHRDDLQRVLAEYRQAREFGRPWRQEFRMVSAEGATIHVGIDANPLPLEANDRGVRFVGLVKDRTHTVLAEQHALETHTLVRELQEAVREGIVIMRGDVVIAANSAAARIVGAESADELIGVVPADLLHPDDRAAFIDLPGSAVLSVRVGRLRRFDGSYVTVVVHGRPVSYAGADARLVAYVPVTDAVITAAVAARNEVQVRALEALIPVPYHRLALNGDEIGTLEFVNLAFASALGYTVDELVGMHVDDITAPDQRDATHEAMRDFIASEGAAPRTFHKRYLHRDGSVVEADLWSAIYRDPVSGRMVTMTISAFAQGSDAPSEPEGTLAAVGGGTPSVGLRFT